MKRINQILNQQSGIAKTAKAAVVCKKSENLLEDFLKIDRLEVSKYQGQTLFVSTSSPTDSQEIFQNKKDIIKKINDKLKTDIKELVFVLRSNRRYGYGSTYADWQKVLDYLYLQPIHISFQLSLGD